MEKTAKTRVSVLLVDDADVQQAATRAAALGMHVEQVLAGVGLLLGEIEPSRLDQLRALPEVAEVEAGRRISIAPPDAPTQ